MYRVQLSRLSWTAVLRDPLHSFSRNLTSALTLCPITYGESTYQDCTVLVAKSIKMKDAMRDPLNRYHDERFEEYAEVVTETQD